jgi:hypothetical protein
MAICIAVTTLNALNVNTSLQVEEVNKKKGKSGIVCFCLSNPNKKLYMIDDKVMEVEEGFLNGKESKRIERI